MPTAQLTPPPAPGDPEADRAWLQEHVAEIGELLKLDRRPNVFIVANKDGFAVSTTIAHIEAHIPYTIDGDWMAQIKGEMKSGDKLVVVALPGPPESKRIYAHPYDRKA